MVYAYKRNDETWIIFFTEDQCPEWMQPDLVYVEESDLPEDYYMGSLYRDADGKFYVVKPEPDPEPELPVEPEKPKPELSVEEIQAQILLNTEYLVSRAELGIGGN